MKIAMIAPPWFAIPPTGQGGAQAVVEVLVDELVRRGQQVVLYSVGSTTTTAELRWLYEDEQKDVLATKPQTAVDSAHVAFAFHDAIEDGADIIHDHSGRIGPTVAAFATGVPVLHTVHTSLHGAARRMYGLLPQRAGFGMNTVSESQRNQAPEVPIMGAVHNAINPSIFPLCSMKRDYLLMLSRITPDKGCHIAMDVARAAGMPMKLAGRPEPTAVGRAYFENEILPRLGPGIEYLGPVGVSEKVPLLAEARALLLPAQWAEPCSMAVLEALASGTPVVATPRGGLPEVVRDGVDGFLCDDAEEMVKALDRLGEIDGAVCRGRVVQSFSPAVLAEKYLSLYNRLTS